jgi:hypothetical protein
MLAAAHASAGSATTKRAPSDVAGLGAGNIFRGKRAAMGFDDLAADRQAQPEFWPKASLAGRSV